jgi:hypothetical protein
MQVGDGQALFGLNLLILISLSIATPYMKQVLHLRVEVAPGNVRLLAAHSR